MKIKVETTGHWLYVVKETPPPLPKAQPEHNDPESHYDYRSLRNGSKDGHILMWAAKYLTGNGNAFEWHVWYANMKMHSGMGKTLKSAVHEAVKYAWLDAAG